jgi:hypothetical protein
MELPHASPPTGPDLEQDFRRLQSLFTWAAGALLLLSLAANLFIGKQWRLVQLQLAAQRDGVIRQAMEFQKRDEPLIRKFVARLQDFAGKHPDFQPVLEQYRPALGRYFSAVTPGPVTPAVPPQAKQTNR